MGNLEQQATGVAFSAKERQVLDYVLKHKREICFLTAGEIAEKMGGSPSSVVRFAKRLGYESFAEFKKTLQDEVSGREQPAIQPVVPYEKIKANEHVPDLELLIAMRQNTISHIQQDGSPESFQKLIDAADLITKARRVFLVGFRACSGFASSLGVMLSCIRPGVQVVGGQQPLIDSLIDIDGQDVLIAISFSRYSSDTIFAAGMAVDMGCPVIAMTDSYASPLAACARVVVVNSTTNMSFYNSYASFVANMEGIVMLVSKRNKDLNENRLMRMEAYLDKTGQY